MRELALYATTAFLCVRSALGGLFVTSPYAGITCHGGQPCTVEWLDDGRQPLLNAIGPSNIALYNQEKTLVQRISASFDVSSARSLTFTPNPEAGPNDSSYFIWIISLNAKDPNSTDVPYMSFSGRFTIDNMSGAPNAPVPSLTSPLPFTTTLSHPPGSTAPSSTTNGVISTTTLPLPSGLTPTVTAPPISSSTLTTISSTFTLDPSQAASLTSVLGGTDTSTETSTSPETTGTTTVSGSDSGTGTAAEAAVDQNNAATSATWDARILAVTSGLAVFVLALFS